MTFKSIVTHLLFLFCTLSVSAQMDLSIGLVAGISQSGNDTHSWGNDGEGILDKTNLVYGLSVEYPLANRFDLRLNWFQSKIEGDDADVLEHEWRGYSFESPLTEVGLDLRWTFWNNFPEENMDKNELDFSTANKRLFSAYLLGGIALSLTDPTLTFDTDPPENQRVNDENNLSKTNLQIPLGAGFRINLGSRLNLDLESRAVIPTTDLLDGMSEIVNPENNDAYLFALLRINYTL